MLSIEDHCLQETAVTPHWTPGGDSFWYRQKLDDDKYQFMFVHAADKIFRPAFDHGKLAKELGQKTGIDLITISFLSSGLKLHQTVTRPAF
ncbi:unnamed protein product [Clonostachys rosea f. rosea IK726]|uniref:Uncharacterized protein n=1 Tax=Clonostachys rosea f. rosea IK726 TaxID=1349383 RepID=A0ACA9T6S6_BIOOC|nr:unnamed protein product [Clonostachys rosea f. rosea IK726]